MSAPTQEEDDPPVHLHHPNEHATVFNPRAYLNDFYSKPDAEGAMHLVLFMIPGLAYLIGAGTNMLDFGCGPTIHLATAFRRTFKHIYMADYAEHNRTELCKWWHNEPGQFDWSAVLDWIRVIEATAMDIEQMAVQTRQVIEGVVACDALLPQPITHVHHTKSPVPASYDLVCSTFCLEYATTNLADYTSAMLNMCSLVSDGGYVLLAGVLGEHSYSTNNTYFQCHHLQKEHVIEALRKAAFNTRDDNSQPRIFKYIERDCVFVLLSKKLPAEAGDSSRKATADSHTTNSQK